MSRFLAIALLLLPIIAVTCAHAQVSAYAEFDASKLTNSYGTNVGTNWLYGATIGLQIPVKTTHHLMLGGDIRGAFTRGSGVTLNGVTFGPVLIVPFRRFSPYVEVLVGFARYNDGLNQLSSASTDSDLRTVVGLDRMISKRLNWRLFEYTYEQYYGLGGEYNPKTFSTGLVYHLTTR